MYGSVFIFPAAHPYNNKKSQNRGKFVSFGKYMGPILGQNLVNVWVSFYFPSGTSLPKRVSFYFPSGTSLPKKSSFVKRHIYWTDTLFYHLSPKYHPFFKWSDVFDGTWILSKYHFSVYLAECKTNSRCCTTQTPSEP